MATSTTLPWRPGTLRVMDLIDRGAGQADTHSNARTA
jgi:hypothetical protein